MSKIILRFSISLDGYAAGPDISRDNPMGIGGERLHEWMRGAPEETLGFAQVGAVVLGRRTYDIGLKHWDHDTPYPAPSYVLTNRAEPVKPTKSAAFTFVTDGIESAIAQARAAAGDRDVIVMGATTAQQALAAGLVDEMQLQLVPTLLGGGSRLIDVPGLLAELKIARVRPEPGVTHLTYTFKETAK